MTPSAVALLGAMLWVSSEERAAGKVVSERTARRVPTALAHRIGVAATAAARRVNLPPAFILAVIEVESSYRPGAVSSVGCLGLMQVAPFNAPRGAHLERVEDGIAAGTVLLARLVRRYGVEEALAAYAMGEGALRRAWRPRGYIRRVLQAYADIQYMLNTKQALFRMDP